VNLSRRSFFKALLAAPLVPVVGLPSLPVLPDSRLALYLRLKREKEQELWADMMRQMEYYVFHAPDIVLFDAD